MQVALSANEQQRLAERSTTNLAAYDAYLRGQAIFASVLWDLPKLRRAIAQYEQAVALDPSFALAWAQLSRARTVVFINSIPSQARAEGAREAAERARQLAPGLPEVRLAMGYYHFWVTRDIARAHAEYGAGLAVGPRHAELMAVTALSELAQGRWEEGLVYLEQARSLDPRSMYAAFLIGRTQLRLRRYPEALTALDRALALEPRDLNATFEKALLFLAQGEPAKARAVVANASTQAAPTTGIAFVASNLFEGASWILDEPQQQLLLHLTPAAFDDDRADWGLALARTYALRGDVAQVRHYASEANQAFTSELGQGPERAERRVAHGLALAFLGRREEAIREGERGMALLPITRDAYSGPWIQHVVVRIYILLGEHEKALDLLEPLLAIPCYLSPGWLSIDPDFAPLRGNPRFERLARGT